MLPPKFSSGWQIIRMSGGLMPNLQMIFFRLIALSYMLILIVTITGFLKLVLRENATIKIIHKFAVPPSILFWVLVMYGAIAYNAGKVITLVTFFTLFLALVFGGALTGWLVKPGLRRVLHMILSSLTFLLFTYFIFGVMLARA